jgi:hypothetical protein
MRTCAGIKANSERCRAQPMRDSQYCLNHDPARAEENKRRSSRGGKIGGRGRPTTDLRRLQHRFEKLAQQVLDGEVDKGVAAVAGQLLNGARACAHDLLTREHEELLARLEKIEEALEAQNKPKPRAPYSA